LLVKGVKQQRLQRLWGNKKGAGTEGTYVIFFLIATQTMTTQYGTDGSATLTGILPHVQKHLELWHGLLQSSSSQLSMSKCSWTPFQWTTDNNGTMHLSPTDDMVQVHLSNDCSTQHILKTNKPSDAVWLLGVHIAADDNYQKELTTLQHHQNKYAQFLIHMLLSQREAKTIHQQCYLPTVMH